MRIYSLLSSSTLLFPFLLVLVLSCHSALSSSATTASLSLFPWGSWPWDLCSGCRVQNILRPRHGCPFPLLHFSHWLQSSCLCPGPHSVLHRTPPPPFISLAICWTWHFFPLGLGTFFPRLNLCLEHPSCHSHSQITRFIRLRVLSAPFSDPYCTVTGILLLFCHPLHPPAPSLCISNGCLTACLLLFTLIDSKFLFETKNFFHLACYYIPHHLAQCLAQSRTHWRFVSKWSALLAARTHSSAFFFPV